jgi:hypothetical protein
VAEDGAFEQLKELLKDTIPKLKMDGWWRKNKTGHIGWVRKENYEEWETTSGASRFHADLQQRGAAIDGGACAQ